MIIIIIIIIITYAFLSRRVDVTENRQRKIVPPFNIINKLLTWRQYSTGPDDTVTKVQDQPKTTRKALQFLAQQYKTRNSD